MSTITNLQERGFVQSATSLESLEELLSGPSRTFYVGFDLTATSLHIGSLVPIMVMAWLQKAGHRPIAVLGGGTTMVGDPSGKDQTREMMSADTIARNKKTIREQLSRFLVMDSGAPNDAMMVDNAEWLLDLRYVDFLRDIGKHFSVNRMLTAEGTRIRLERNQGLSFIEFNYHLLQSYDFLVLNQRYDCVLQVGGDDQWFHILGGMDLIRRERGTDAFGFTVPLITTAAGKKMGKTEKGAVWLSSELVSAYDYFQYWVNVADADVDRFLKLYTFLDMERINALSLLKGAEIREAKQVLAYEATAIAHGPEEAKKAREAASKVFAGGGEGTEMPQCALSFPVLAIDAYVCAGLAASKGAARRLIQQGGARFGEIRITSLEEMLTEPGILWAGKKRAVRLLSE